MGQHTSTRQHESTGRADLVTSQPATDPATAPTHADRARVVMVALGAGCLGFALVLPWLSTALSVRSDAAQLHLRLPGMTWLDAVTYEHLVVLALGLVVVGAGVELAGVARHSLLAGAATKLYRFGGVAAGIAAIGLVLQLLSSDARTRLALQGDQNEFTLFTSQLTYRVPQPQISQLLFLHLNRTQTLVLSALRLGWYLSLLGAVLLVVVPRGRDARVVPRPVRLTMRAGAVLLAGVLVGTFVVGSLRGVVAGRAAAHAAGLAAAGQYPAASARYADALSLNPELAFDPDVTAGVGRARLEAGLAAGSAGAYATALDQAAANEYDGAITTLRRAILIDPGNAVLSGALTQIAVTYAVKQQSPTALAEQPDRVLQRALTRFTRGRLEVATGQLTSGINDLRIAISLTRNGDLRSAALTLISVGQQRAGDLLTARRTLESALAADAGHYNLVARALATGLYSGASR